jgi:hypothetical protein
MSTNRNTESDMVPSPTKRGRGAPRKLLTPEEEALVERLAVENLRQAGQARCERIARAVSVARGAVLPDGTVDRANRQSVSREHVRRFLVARGVLASSDGLHNNQSTSRPVTP